DSATVLSLITHHHPFIFFVHTSSTTALYTLSLHDALPISDHGGTGDGDQRVEHRHRRLEAQQADGHHRHREEGHHDLGQVEAIRSEEHTSELQSRENLVCRLLLEKKKNEKNISNNRKSQSI